MRGQTRSLALYGRSTTGGRRIALSCFVIPGKSIAALWQPIFPGTREIVADVLCLAKRDMPYFETWSFSHPVGGRYRDIARGHST